MKKAKYQEQKALAYQYATDLLLEELGFTNVKVFQRDCDKVG